MKKIVFAMGLIVSIFLGQNIYAQCVDTLKWKTVDIYYIHFYDMMNSKYTMGSLTDCIIDTKKTPNFIPMGIIVSSVDNSARTINFEYTISNSKGEVVYTSLNKVPLSNKKAGDTSGVCQADNSTIIDITKFDAGNYTIKLWVKSTSLDGEFCDSIKELSSCTANFQIVHGGNAVNQIASFAFNVFPNPASEQLNITCGEEMRSIALFNTAGQRVRQMEPCGSEVQIPLSGLPRGLYLLCVQTANGNAVRKVVVE